MDKKCAGQHDASFILDSARTAARAVDRDEKRAKPLTIVATCRREIPRDWNQIMVSAIISNNS
jgi:hypothetical protein